MLTRFVRIQLLIFATLAVGGVLMMAISYLQAPAFLGIGKLTVTLQLPNTGGLYRFANVTYRGVQIGKVTDVVPTAVGAQATLVLNTSPKVPADLQAQIRSISAVGEQYVDLRPRNDSPPYLHDGSIIPTSRAKVPQQVGPMLDQVSALINSIPKGKLGALQDEMFKAFNGSGYDLQSLFDSASTVTGAMDANTDTNRALIDDSAPLLDAQAQSAGAIRHWTHDLAGVTEHFVRDDQHVRTLLHEGPDAANELSRLLEQIKPTLPVMLANLSSLGQVGVTYNKSLEQLLVLLPPFTAHVQGLSPWNNPTGLPFGDFRIEAADPAACTVGFLPPDQWRSPADTTTIDTPDGLYCKLPQDSPMNVRGARNYPCMGVPGKRAPTVQQCNSDKPYEPLAQRQHVLGAYPFDPNLVAQGIPPDSRAQTPNGGNEHLTPAPSAPPIPPPPNVPNAIPAPPDEPDSTAPGAAPSSLTINGSRAAPSVAEVHYDPKTGKYVGVDGHSYTQSNIAASAAPKSWRDLVLTRG